MQFADLSFILLIISTLLALILLRYVLKKKPIAQIQKLLALMLSSVLIICIGLIIQKFCVTLFNVKPIYFENFIYIGTCTFPVFFYLMALSFVNTKIDFNKKYLLFFVIPISALLVLFTNDFHHLFYKNYSFNLNEMEYGPYMYVHLAYTYGLFFLGVLMMLRHTTKNSGFFSKQSFLIIAGVSIPVIVNVLGFLNIIEIDVYQTPISFSFAVLFVALAVFKYDFLSVTPIALEKVVDRMSDSYIVLNDKNIIIDFNKSFLSTFRVKEQTIRNTNIFDWNIAINLPKLKQALQNVSVSPKTVSFEAHVEKIDKYFNVEVSSIINRRMFLGTLILFKDITQHIHDLNTIQSNQDLLIEKERFATLRSNDRWNCS